jgi:transposase InsO family protein
MNIHKKTRLTPFQRKEIFSDRHVGKMRITDLCHKYCVTAPTIYKVLKRGRGNDFSVHKSTNVRYRVIEYGLKRLAKIEHRIEERLKKQALRYNKEYPGEMMHFDTKRLPLINGEKTTEHREHLFVGIDDYSRELYAEILPNKTQESAAAFLTQVIDECPYTIEIAYSDNGTEYRGKDGIHAFMNVCKAHRIEQRHTKVRHPQTNGKAERVIKTLMEMWHTKTVFKNREHRKKELIRFVNYYNTVKSHAGIDDNTPLEQLIKYFYPKEL